MAKSKSNSTNRSSTSKIRSSISKSRSANSRTTVLKQVSAKKPGGIVAEE